MQERRSLIHLAAAVKPMQQAQRVTKCMEWYFFKAPTANTDQVEDRLGCEVTRVKSTGKTLTDTGWHNSVAPRTNGRLMRKFLGKSGD